MSSNRKLCYCIPIKWAAFIAESILLCIGVLTLILGGLFKLVSTSKIALPSFIIFFCVYAPLIVVSTVGAVAVVRRNLKGLTLNIQILYVNIVAIVLADSIGVLLLATTRKTEIERECAEKNFENTSDLDYLTNPIGTALGINNGCRIYWRNVVLLYAICFWTSAFIMVLCVLTLRIYRNELQKTEPVEEDQARLAESVEEEDDYKPFVSHIEKHGPEGGMHEEQVQSDYYHSRSALYSKIYHKKDLKKDLRNRETPPPLETNLRPPKYVVRSKSPTVEKMEYDRFRESQSANIPLERQSVTSFKGEQWASHERYLSDAEDD